MPKKKALVATGNSVLTIFYALLSDPAASYHDLGPDYYEQRMNTRRQARSHVRSLERLGYKVTIEALDPRHRHPPRHRELTRRAATADDATRRRTLPPAQTRFCFRTSTATAIAPDAAPLFEPGLSCVGSARGFQAVSGAPSR